MFSFFKPNFIEKFLLGTWFFKFWSYDYFRKKKISFLAAILKRIIFFFFFFFLLIYVYTDMVQVSYRNSYGKVLKYGWSKWPPFVHKREWKVAEALKC